VYYGARVYYRFLKNKLSGLPRGERNDEIEWKISEDAHPGFVSKKLFDQANTSKQYKYAGGGAMAVWIGNSDF